MGAPESNRSLWARVLVTLFAAAVCHGQALAGGYEAIHVFGPPPDGSVPEGGLSTDAQGRLYGSTILGGTFGFGTIFRLTPPTASDGPWTEEVLHSFDIQDGVNPEAAPVIAADGTIYGTTLDGGAFGRGTIFKIQDAPGFPYTDLHDLSSMDGLTPTNLAFGTDGNLYGITGYDFGHKNYLSSGTDFRFALDTGTYTTLHIFGHPGDGFGPYGLTSVPNGTPNLFLGATIFFNDDGAAANTGIVYALKAQPGGKAVETILHVFGKAPDDVNQPLAAPIVGRFGLKGMAYGCGSAGGSLVFGGVYQIALSGTYPESVIYNFGGEPRQPAYQCFLDQASAAGLLYGVSLSGGRYNQGTFFELDPPATPGGAWSGKVDVDFNPANSAGANPIGPILRLHGIYYGQTRTAVYALRP